MNAKEWRHHWYLESGLSNSAGKIVTLTVTNAPNLNATRALQKKDQAKPNQTDQCAIKIPLSQPLAHLSLLSMPKTHSFWRRL